MAPELAGLPSPAAPPPQAPVALQRALWVLLAGVLVGVVAAGLLWSLDRPAGTWGGGNAGGPDPPGPALPDFSLTDQDGSRVTRADLAGKPWVAGFIFTRCRTLCPRVTARMAALQGTGVALVSFSVDPEWDRPEVLRRYAGEHGAKPGWRFLTGSREEVHGLVAQGFRLSVGPGPGGVDLVIHSDRLALVDARGRIRGTYPVGDPPAMARLRRDLEALGRER